MKQLNTLLSLFLIALSFQSFAGSDEQTHGVNQNNEESPTRAMASFVLKNQSKEQTLSIDSKSEQSFQKLFKAINIQSLKDQSLESLSCQAVDDGNGKTHLELSYPGKKNRGNGTFYKINGAQWKEDFSQGEIFGDAATRRAKVLSSFSSVEDKSRTDTPDVFMKIKARDQKTDSTLTSITTHNFERRNNRGDSAQYYRANKDAIGSPLYVAFSAEDMQNVCNAIHGFKDIKTNAGNAESNSGTLYNVKVDSTKGNDAFSKIEFSTLSNKTPKN